MRTPPSFLLDTHDAVVLRGWVRDGAQATLGRRVLIVLLCAQGHGPSAVALWTKSSKQTVITWRNRYITEGLDGLRDAPRSGRPVTVNPAAVVLATLRRPDPAGRRWSTRSLGAALGISNVSVANVWRDWGIRPEPGGRVSLRTEPVLDPAVLAVLGLHIDPPIHLLALAVIDHRDDVPGGDALDTTGPRPGLGDRLDDVLTSAGPGPDQPAALRRVLTRLDHTAAATTPTMQVTAPGDADAVRTALIVTGDIGSVGGQVRDTPRSPCIPLPRSRSGRGWSGSGASWPAPRPTVHGRSPHCAPRWATTTTDPSPGPVHDRDPPAGATGRCCRAPHSRQDVAEATAVRPSDIEDGISDGPDVSVLSTWPGVKEIPFREVSD